MTIHKSIMFFHKKKTIDKAFHKRTAHKVQLYNNQLVDKFVENFNTAGEPSKPAKATMRAELAILNKPEVYKNYNRIINSKYTSNDNLNKLLVKNKAQKQLSNVVEGELNRIAKNLDYVEAVMKKYEVPTQQYKSLLNEQKNKSVANRQKILKEVAIKNNDLLVSEGLNIPSNVFSYHELETTAQSLLRQSQMTAGFEEKQAINENYLNEGKNEIYTHKQWIHTDAGATTRHESNHMQKVPFDEPFIVVNDKTLEIDEMMYPCDPAGSFSNAWICYCEVDYLIGEDDPVSETLGLNGSIDIANPDLFNTPTVNETSSVTFLPNIKGLFDSKASGEVSNKVNLESPKIFDEARFNELKTHEEVAEFFGLEYNENGVKFDAINGETIEFYDPKYKSTIRVFKDKHNKPQSLDLTNSDNANVNLKDFIRAYDNAPVNLKKASGEIRLINGDEYSPGGDCGGHTITIYDSTLADHNTILSTRRLGEYGEFNTMETNLYHEMTHALDNLFIKVEQGEFIRMDTIAEELRGQWKEATKLDYEFQKQNGMEKQDSTLYGEEQISEDFAEFGGAVSSKLIGRTDTNMWHSYSIKTPKGRRKQFISELLEANPNRVKLMEDLLTNEHIVSDKNKIKDVERMKELYKENNML